MEDINYKLKYLVLPDFVYSDNRLTLTSVKVFSFINSYKGDKFYFTNDQMAEMFGVSSHAISLSIKKLIDLKYVSVSYEIRSGGGKVRFITNLKSDFTQKSSRTLPKSKLLYIKDNKIKDIKEINKEKEIKLLLTEQILPYWNQRYGTQYKSPEALIENASHWLTIYSVDDVKLAISKIKYHKFWKDKMTPTMFFRRMGKNREQVDYIGDLMNVSDSNRFSMIPGM